MLKPGPAIHQDEDSQSREPQGLLIERESYESQHANQAQNGRNHEAASSSQNKPEERSQNLTAVERVDRKEIENQQSEIDVEDCLQKPKEIVLAGRQARNAAGPDDNPQYGKKHNVDEGTRGDAPERGAWTWRRINIGDPAHGPKHDAVRNAANLAAGQGMAEFVNQYDKKQAQILGDIPRDGGISPP